MSPKAVKAATKLIRPILSMDHHDARRRVLKLYKSWYRQIPYIVKKYEVPKNIDSLKQKLREEFRKNDKIKDLRIIDMLLVKGQMELQETANFWKQRNTFMNSFFRDTVEHKPKDFFSKFLAGH